MKMHTTHISSVFQDKAEPMTGEEIYPVEGKLINQSEAMELISKCKGLHPHFNCLDKAILVREALGYGNVVVGSLLVWNERMDANFGYFWNPPLEFHAWWEPGHRGDHTQIIDIALPGVIQKALNTCDHIGPLVENREPFILAGKPFEWTTYTAHDVVRL